MANRLAETELEQLPVRHIDRNPENPRLIFRQGELDALMDSVRQYGVQVPIAVYRDGRRYILIDGERRWRCSLKLNLQTIPALVQPKPAQLDNLLLMFNIHALREQWDLLTIALKLPRIENLLIEQGHHTTEAQLALQTGLPRAVIRRCKMLAQLPEEYKEEIKQELRKPKAQQKITEDLFIEIEKSLKTVSNRMPDAMPPLAEARQIILDKYKNKTYESRIDLRLIPKIANAAKVGADVNKAKNALKKLFTPNNYSIQAAYTATVQDAYLERNVVSRISSLKEHLTQLDVDDVDDELRHALESLVDDYKRLQEG
ncbi:MAG: ParB/RepB/Spo0J family partition protein [Tepidisphaeraceae bacterium]